MRRLLRRAKNKNLARLMSRRLGAALLTLPITATTPNDESTTRNIAA